MDLNLAILYAQLINAAYAIAPDNTANAAGQTVTVGTAQYDVITSIFANDLCTDMNPDRGKNRVSIGLVLQASAAGDVVVAVRGTEGIQEWIHDAQFLPEPCPFMAAAGHTEDGFTDMYRSMRTGLDPASPTFIQALPKLQFPRTATSLTVCGHSLGGALATLLALDVAVNTTFNPTVYTYASPRTGDPQFVSVYNHAVANTTRIASRLDLVPKLPLPPLYEHVLGLNELNSVRLTPLPPKILIKPDLACLHILTSYLYLLSLQAGGSILALKQGCGP